MTPLGTRLHTWLHGTFVGEDRFGNRYYRSKRIAKGVRERRWVLFKGMTEASKIPPEWHGWMHHTYDAVPVDGTEARRYEWQKDHQPNYTGTKYAYLPQGHILRGGDRPQVSADYEPWQP